MAARAFGVDHVFFVTNGTSLMYGAVGRIWFPLDREQVTYW